MIKKLRIQFFILTTFFLVLPAVASAAAYNYTCGDLTSGDSPVCVDGTWAKATPFSLIDSSGDRPFAAGTWYFNGVVSGSGTPFRLTCYEYSSATCNTYTALSAGTYVDEPFTVNSGTSVGVYFWGQGSTDPGVGDICITDTLGGCEEEEEEGGGGGGGDFGALLDTASLGFGDTTGFDVGAAVVWSGDNLIGLFIGSALGVLLALRYWIAAALIIAAIVYFCTRAFVFFRN